MATRKTASGAIAALVVLSGMVAGCRVDGTQASGDHPNPIKSAAAGSGAPTVSTYSPPALAWGACSGLPTPAPSATPLDPALECAKLKVPLDYAKPDGDTIDLAVIRLRSSGPASTRIGSLLFNPGGPGASGVDMLAQSSGDYAKLRERYDLVGFDPRGVARSAPVTCLSDQQINSMAGTDGTPDTPEEERAFLADQATFMKGCQARSARILPYVGTVNAARDMDVLRRALGDRYLHYFGISYGTWLGANYAHQFPGKVGRMVLDGAMNTKLDTKRLLLQQTAGFQLALDNYAEWEAQQPATKAAGVTKEQIVDRIGTFVRDLDAKPIPTGDPARPLNQGLGETGVTLALYSKQFWPTLTEALQRAFQGDAALLLRMADLYDGRDKDGHYTNEGTANTAVRCDDTTRRYTVADVRAMLPEFTRASPIFGPSMAWGLLQCTGWPVKGNDAAQEVSAPNAAAPIVVVGNTGDPATPYAWASAMAGNLGSGVLLTLRGQGHSAYDTGNPCLVGAVNAYLLHGVVPARGTVCG